MRIITFGLVGYMYETTLQFKVRFFGKK